MKTVTEKDMRTLTVPYPDSHKGQNGRLLVVGGSSLFHAASLWSLEVASRIVDLVHYASTPENNELIIRLKSEFRNGIVVPREDIERYIEEDDAILIGPGMMRAEGDIGDIDDTIASMGELAGIEHEGMLTYHLTRYLLQKFPEKQWIIDAGSLQMLRLEDIPRNAILTPHHGEFASLCGKSQTPNLKDQTISNEQKVIQFAKHYNCIVLLKGQEDIASNGKDLRVISGGNEGMTKGGTGDVLAGLIAALVCINDPMQATIAGSFINKKAGDAIYERVGPFFNASDLAGQIPVTMRELLT